MRIKWRPLLFVSVLRAIITFRASHSPPSLLLCRVSFLARVYCFPPEESQWHSWNSTLSLLFRWFAFGFLSASLFDFCCNHLPKKKKKKVSIFSSSSLELRIFYWWLTVISSLFVCSVIFFLRTLILKWLATFLVCFVDVEAPSEWFSFFPILKLRFSYLLLILHFLLLLFLPLLGLFVEYWKKSFGDVLANSTRSAYCCYCQKWFVWSLWGALFVFGNYLRFFEGLIEFRRKMGKRTEGEIKL